MNEFLYTGSYRVQSRRDKTASLLKGKWLYDKPFLLDSGVVNHELRKHPQWLGGTFIEICPALVTKRLGKFESEPDILYKQDFFTPDPGTSPMNVNIVDVLKSCSKWITRSKYSKRIFTDDTYSQIADLMDHLDVIIANEYYLHEAGHFLGYDVQAKYSDGYFSPAGNTAWPLIYVEELRADLHAFGFGRILLPPREAAKILIYNIALRFGVHFEGITTLGIAPYGLTPYLLFCVLRELGFISVVEANNGGSLFRLMSFDTDEISEVMYRCAKHAENLLTAPEASLRDPIERAVSTAQYVRRRLNDKTNLEAYASVMNYQCPQ